MTPKVLFIDDDAFALAGYGRIARRSFSVETSTEGEDGLDALTTRGPFDVIISDMRMPGMNGAEVLRRARQLSPDTTRILLTGHADTDSAIDAVNLGNVFRFLVKPCPPDTLLAALRDAVAQTRLVVSERELREKTLQSCLKILTDVLAMVHPTAFGRVGRVRDLVIQLGQRLNVENQWELPIAASLCLLGTVALSDGVMARVLAGNKVSDRERGLLESHPRVAYEMLAGIPRLDGVAHAVLYQTQRYNGTGGYTSPRRGAEIPMGARLLKVAMDFEAMIGLGYPRNRAFAEMNRRDGWYDPEVIEALASIVEQGPARPTMAIAVADVKPGMVLVEPLYYADGTEMLKKGQHLSSPVVHRIRAVAESVGIREPIVVTVSDENGEPVIGPADEMVPEATTRLTEFSEIHPFSDTDPHILTAFPELFKAP